MPDKSTKPLRIDVANEVTVLGTAVTNATDERVVTALRRFLPHEFLDARHRKLWTAFRTALNRGSWYDAGVVRRLLDDDAVADYLATVEAAGGSVDRLDEALRALRWDACRNACLSEPIPALLDALGRPSADPATVNGLARRVVSALEGHSGHVISAQGMRDAYADELILRGKRDVSAFGTGWPEVDEHLALGFAPGTTSLFAGLTGVGKSTMMAALTDRLALVKKRRVAYFAWEERAIAVLDKMVASRTGIHRTKIIRGDLSATERRRCNLAAQEILEYVQFVTNPFLNLQLHGNKRLTNADVLQIVCGMLAETACEVAIYDMWSRMPAQRSPDDVALALYSTQQIHVDFGVAGILVGQVNAKDVLRRTYKEITVADVKGIGDAVEITDICGMVNRAGHLKGRPVTDTMDLTIEKQRDGRAPLKFRFRFEADYARLSEPRLLVEDDADDLAGVVFDDDET